MKIFMRPPKQNSECGAGMLEYAVLISLITLVALGAVRFLGGQNLRSLEDSNVQIQCGLGSIDQAFCP
jgi:Flp pilus assembly pilin Flp